MVTVTRILSERPLFQGGRDHPAHRLVVMGLPERRAVLFLYGIGALAGSIALAISSMEFLAGFSEATLPGSPLTSNTSGL